MIDFSQFDSLIAMTMYFNNEDTCRHAIIETRWGVGDEHLQQYIDEAVYRWNTRKMSESERFAHMFDKSIGLVKKWSEIRVGLMAA